MENEDHQTFEERNHMKEKDQSKSKKKKGPRANKANQETEGNKTKSL